MIDKIFTLVIAPVFVGLVLEMISRWLDEKDDN
ncbi:MULTISPECIES: type I toxin-antitoxin system Fst family toxin [Enterococcus]|uniref:Type I toxin-antitoxin system Fst family toxin n=1 Tax=Enterococcus gallinarum TaxID=1353 RepID=A0ABD4ZWL0_ENTGA|nr:MULTISPECIES: type I toxin-antitoxin system Fst family toxin [Enterococcus]MBX8979614.1 type I toxin-antitoxin system Fst family toxin [Enterococcus gallinarum]MCR1932964.1 type I toxin-antitoxin system Fst family toxin [Enterococcus gallinarum]MCR1946113.1 type I toxin-antitoxin system Fst family toxin [Enterococcus gallinarum]MDL4876592.1 type I toxin-antitoxin system Fst family toxin [Enterococcus gallinarum]MDL4883078.1 type I toxin-antitoxin system Fst family toxin [Enterococcus gallin